MGVIGENAPCYYIPYIAVKMLPRKFEEGELGLKFEWITERVQGSLDYQPE